MINRRQFLQTSALGVAVTSTGLGMLTSAQAQTDPIRIGLMAPLTGVIAAGGREMVEGTQFWFEKINYQIAGRKVELIIEDDASNPDTALQKARRLVEQNNVHFLTGNLLANTGLAVANYVKGNGMPYFIPIIAADELTQRSRIPNVVRTAGYSGSAFPRPLADWALKQGYKRIATVSQDYTFGHEQCGGFSQVFTEGGGAIVQQFWHPLNTADYSPYLGQIADLKIDAIFVMETGADAVRFTQQFASFGLKGKIPLLGAMNMTDQSVIRTMGPEVEGIISAAHFAEGSDSAATKSFVDAYTQKYEKIPSLYGFSMYSGMMWVTRAIEKLNGKIDDKAAFLQGVFNTELTDSPLGKPVKLDKYGNPVYDVMIRKVVKRSDGKFWNVPIESYPAVSQFWKYDPETFMKEPAYSRTYQGIKKS